jgi:exonuclease VII small subunit
LRSLREGLCRHERTRQRRPLPLLRLHRPPEVRAEGLRQPAPPSREARTRRHHSADPPLPRQRSDRGNTRQRATGGRATPEIEQRLAAIQAEITRGEQALERYYEAFEQGKLSPERCDARLTRLQTRLDDLHAQRAELSNTTPHTATQDPTAAELAALADQLETLLTSGEPEKAKALLRELVAELKVNGKTEILPSYYLNAAPVCATSEKVGGAGIEPATSSV